MSDVRRMNNALVIPLDLIDPHPANVREQLGDLTELAESIRVKGLLQAVVVRQHGPRFQLITGHRRCAAARLVGRVEVPAIVREATDDDVIEDMLVENMHRRRLNPIEEANAFQALVLRGKTQGQVASAVGVSMFTVNKRIALLDLSEVEQRAIANKSMSLGEGWEIAHQRRWARGERRGQGVKSPREIRPRWVPHFNRDHPLAEIARARCLATHEVLRVLKLSDVACGACWEATIRDDALRRDRDLARQLPQPGDRPAVDLADAGLGHPQLGADVEEPQPGEVPLDDVAVVAG